MGPTLGAVLRDPGEKLARRPRDGSIDEIPRIQPAKLGVRGSPAGDHPATVRFQSKTPVKNPVCRGPYASTHVDHQAMTPAQTGDDRVAGVRPIGDLDGRKIPVPAKRASPRGPLDQDPPALTHDANLVIIETPFPEKTVEAHVDTSRGHALPDDGHIADAEMTVTMTYETLRELFVAQDAQAVQMAFMSGQIRVDGDMTRLMFLFDVDPDPDAEALGREIEDRLRAITI